MTAIVSVLTAVKYNNYYSEKKKKKEQEEEEQTTDDSGLRFVGPHEQS